MEIIATAAIEEKEYRCFFEDETLEWDIAELKENGYFLYRRKEAIAFFTLIPVEEKSYWLSKLVMKKDTPILLPVTVIEAAERLSKSYGAASLYIHSHTAILNDLLTQLGYHRSEQAIDQTLNAEWWITDIKSVDKPITYIQE